MLENQKVKIKWNSYTKKYYIEKGYNFTKIGDEFFVDVFDLQQSSGAKVKVICDYCGKEFEKTYKNYNIGRKSVIQKDSCESCKGLKRKDVLFEKYGVVSPTKIEGVREKQIKTMLQKYGVESYSSTEEGKEKIRQTNLRKYGSEYFTTSDKFKKISLEKYGVDNPGKSGEVRQKAMESFVKNSTVPKSKGEIKTCEMLIEMFGSDKCFPSYQVDSFALDCLIVINGVKIDFEYDGKYWHEQRKVQDRARDEILKAKGFKVFRVVSSSKIPSKEQITEGINYLLSDDSHNFTRIYI